MDSLALPLALIVGAYLLGAIPFGILVVRWRTGTDVRTVGSGNIGATNVARAAGKKAAGLVLLLDALKGFLPTLAALLLLDDPWWIAGVGFASFVGHCFPVYLRFRGGKGVATALGVNLALTPLAALAGVVVYVGLFKLFRISALGSLGGALAGAAVAFLVAPSSANAWVIVAMVLVIFGRHTGNIRRMLQRQENRI